MQKKLSIKKKLNNTLYKKKLESNNFALVLENSFKKANITNKILFTKILLKNSYLTKFSKKNILHFPLNFYFFKSFNEYTIFIKKHFKHINILKIKNKIFKKKILSNFFLFNNPANFLNINYSCFFN